MALLVGLDHLISAIRGDCKLRFNPYELRKKFKFKRNNQLRAKFQAFFENQSLKEQALLIFAYAQLVPQNKEAKQNSSWIRVTLAESPRTDGYFEATLVKPGKRVPVQFDLVVDGNPEKIELELLYGYYGRKPLITHQLRFEVPLNTFAENEEELQIVPQPTLPRKAERAEVIPIQTHLVFPGEKLERVITNYTHPLAEPGDWIAIAESVVAIAQGRVYPVFSIKPGFWAKRLNLFFNYDSSMASCYSMQLAIEEVSLLRIMAGIIAGILGKILGRNGDFYRVTGRMVASIDDCTGTLPPFDKSVVLGPKNPNETAVQLSQATGLEIAIVDANDLRKVDVLGKSSGIVAQELQEAIRDNPQGNADEQTPLVLIKRGKKNPLHKQRVPLEGEK